MLKPWYLTGLVDGEGSFCITISKHKTKKLGFDPRLSFEIEMIIEDKPLLEKVKETLKCGNVYTLSYERYGWRPHAKFSTKSQKEIFGKIIPFFKKYPMYGKKQKDFEFFCEAAEIFKSKNHLTIDGINKLREIQSKMNLRKKVKLASARVRENRVPSGNGDQ
jgi:hypothetical protein